MTENRRTLTTSKEIKKPAALQEDDLLALAYSNPNRKWWQFWKPKMVLEFMTKPVEKEITMVERVTIEEDGTTTRTGFPVKGSGCLFINTFPADDPAGPSINLDDFEREKH